MFVHLRNVLVDFLLDNVKMVYQKTHFLFNIQFFLYEVNYTCYKYKKNLNVTVMNKINFKQRCLLQDVFCNVMTYSLCIGSLNFHVASRRASDQCYQTSRYVGNMQISRLLGQYIYIIVCLFCVHHCFRFSQHYYCLQESNSYCWK